MAKPGQQNPTNKFTEKVPRHPPIDKFYAAPKRQSPDFEALGLCKDWSGCRGSTKAKKEDKEKAASNFFFGRERFGRKEKLLYFFFSLLLSLPF